MNGHVQGEGSQMQKLTTHPAQNANCQAIHVIRKKEITERNDKWSMTGSGYSNGATLFYHKSHQWWCTWMGPLLGTASRLGTWVMHLYEPDCRPVIEGLILSQEDHCLKSIALVLVHNSKITLPYQFLHQQITNQFNIRWPWSDDLNLWQIRYMHRPRLLAWN